MQLVEGYRLLRLNQGASLDEVKSAYRKLAFSMHPDLNANDPGAAKQFQRLNEAYVLVKEHLEEEAASPQHDRFGPKRPGGRADSRKEKPAASASGGAAGAYDSTRQRTGKRGAPTREEVLRDILKDPFARQVFEDIYREVKQGHRASKHSTPNFQARTAHPNKPPPSPKTMRVEWGDKKVDVDVSDGIVTAAKKWVRGWLDDEQTMHLPAFHLRPGSKVRLNVQQGFGAEPKAVEVVLPPDFVVGRPIRLKGLGRKFGPVKGDLYLRILAK